MKRFLVSISFSGRRIIEVNASNAFDATNKALRKANREEPPGFDVEASSVYEAGEVLKS